MTAALTVWQVRTFRRRRRLPYSTCPRIKEELAPMPMATVEGGNIHYSISGDGTTARSALAAECRAGRRWAFH